MQLGMGRIVKENLLYQLKMGKPRRVLLLMMAIEEGVTGTPMMIRLPWTGNRYGKIKEHGAAERRLTQKIK